ncbi:enoyl-CoA hydratase [Marmoricola sp. OAE513]|uniref:enoyl-CoA hydratase/isomerase family protein n=1 Tax=Marmoricola sp. OAE513 TaxID=2817894 RepID=UPI001AE7A17D
MEPVVLCEVTDGVARLTLNRPDKLNALTAQSFAELRTHLETLATREDIAVLVLSGAGRSFCAGHDLASLAAGDALESRYEEAETVDLLEAFPAPTIAKIHGHCFTGGLELALGCDLLIASDTAQIGDTHTAWGLAPVWGMSVRLPERIGRSAAKELSFTSRRIDGRIAASIGLVDRSVPDIALDGTVAALVAEIKACSPGANRIVKRLYADAATRPRTEALLYERDMPYGIAADAVERLGGK